MLTACKGRVPKDKSVFELSVSPDTRGFAKERKRTDHEGIRRLKEFKKLMFAKTSA